MSLRKNRGLIKLQDKETVRFLKLSAKERVLYDSTLGEYRDNDLRIAAATRISKKLNIRGFGPKAVITKLENLRNTYCRTLKKIAESEHTGAGKDDVYIRKVFWFDLMDSFIRPFVNQYPTSSNMKKETRSKENSTPLTKKPILDLSSSDDDPDEEFEVEKITGERKASDGKTQYKLHWRGYDTDEETWENESNLDCPEIMEQFKTIIIKKPRLKRKPKNGTANDSTSSPNEAKRAEKIVGLRSLNHGKREVLVRWKDLPQSHDSWEPEENFMDIEIHKNLFIKEKEVIPPNPIGYSHADQSQSEILSADNDNMNESIPCTSLNTDNSTTETPNAIEKLGNPNRSAISKKDSYDFFGKYVASTLRSIGQSRSITLQEKITSVISKELTNQLTDSSINLGDFQVQNTQQPEDGNSCSPNHPIEGNMTNQKVSGKTFSLPSLQATSPKKRRLDEKETEFDIWCKSLATHINNMETVRALILQIRIQNVVAQDKIRYEMQKHPNPSTGSYANQPSASHFNQIQQETSDQLNSIKDEIDENVILIIDKSDDEDGDG